MGNTLSSKRLCFLGAGSIAEAIVRGILDRQLTSADSITMLNRQNQTRLAELRVSYSVHADLFHADAVKQADIIILAMKPKDAPAVLNQIKSMILPQQLFVSVIAGLSIETAHQLLGNRTLPIVRTMPNTSSAIGLGATGMSFSPAVSSEQQQQALQIFQSCGIVHVVAENLLDIVTGVSGSGPAYVYYLMEGMIAAGIQGGLTTEAATELTMQTVLGAAHMVKTTGEQPSELRRKVTSPGGSTQAAIDIFDQYHFQEAVRKAVSRSAERSAEMGAMIGGSAR